MAKDAKPVDEAADSGAPVKNNKKLIIMIVAAVVVFLLAAGGGAYLLLKKGDPAAEDEEAAEEVSKPKKKDKKADGPPAFVNLDPFTVNLVPETGDQYLQVVLSLELEDSHAEPTIKNLMPKIRNSVTLLLSSKKASELMPREGKQQLAAALKDEINNIVEPPARNKKGETMPSKGPVQAVLFTSFIIQ